jgi:hypothetical protein
VEVSQLGDRTLQTLDLHFLRSRSLFLGFVGFEDFDQARELQDFPGGCTGPNKMNRTPRLRDAFSASTGEATPELSI